MTQEQDGDARELVVLVRSDGQGELRDGDEITRMRADDADELRTVLMERAVGIAVDGRRAVQLRVIDIDGIYDLVVTPDGGVDVVGDRHPLQPGDDELTPERAPAPQREAKSGYAARFGMEPDEPSTSVDQPSEPVHESERLPRAEMMSNFNYDEVLTGDDVGADVPLTAAGLFDQDAPSGAATHAHPTHGGAAQPAAQPGDQPAAQPGDQPAAQPEEPQPTDAQPDEAAPAHRSVFDQDAPVSAAGLFDEDAPHSGPAPAQVPAEDDDLDDDYHDAGLDHEFDTDAMDIEPAPATEPEVTAPNTAEWSPRFLRDETPNRGAAREPRIPAEPTEPTEPALPALPALPKPAAEPKPAAASAAAPATASTETPAVPPVPQHRPNPEGAPTLSDFFADKPAARRRPAEFGWRAGMRRATGGLITLGPGVKERARRDEIAAIQRSFQGPRTIVVMNPKGGAHKTTATLMIAATFGTFRGGYTLAWDNNETRGTLGWRSKRGTTTNTAVDLLRELPRFEIAGGATIADVDRYVRNQGDSKFDVLASDDDAASAAIIDDDAFSRLHQVLSRFYRIMVIDTGNNMRASNWEAALETADQLVIVSTAREDTAASAAWLADGLRERGYGDKLANAVTILSSPSEKEDPVLTNKLTTHFRKLTRAVVAVPYDHEFVGGGELHIPSLQPATLDAWRHAAAVIAQGL